MIERLWLTAASKPILATNLILNLLALVIGIILIVLLLRRAKRLERVLRLTGFLDKVEEWEKMRDESARRHR
jgi:hypothetical protein